MITKRLPPAVRSRLDILGDALRLLIHPGQPGELAWSTETARCATQCGQPVVLGEPHYTGYLDIERMRADGELDTTPDGDELFFAHLACWPDASAAMVIETRIGAPDHATVRRAAE